MSVWLVQSWRPCDFPLKVFLTVLFMYQTKFMLNFKTLEVLEGVFETLGRVRLVVPSASSHHVKLS